jgi:hypothetical protein
MKKAIKSANICANIYEGRFVLDFDCAGVEMCRYALCSIMPQDGSEECTYREYGSCRNLCAQNAAIETLRNRLTKELKDRAADE